jgi:hypothetical protein
VTNVLAAELDLENLLLRIPHVLGARVQVGAGGTVEKIHVLANRATGPERLAYDIERLLQEQRALRLDPGVVSVVSLEDGAPGAEATPAQPALDQARIELRRLTFDPLDELRIRCTAELKLHEIVFTGVVSETDVPQARPAIAARAVLAGLEFLREQGAAFYLVGIEFLTGFHSPVALVLIEGIGGRERRSLSGCALVTESRESAAARATLSAINRFYGILKRPGAP